MRQSCKNKSFTAHHCGIHGEPTWRSLKDRPSTIWPPFSLYRELSQTVPAQRHLATLEVPAGAKASVFGGVSCTAEEERFTLQAALPAKYRKRWKDVVDFWVYHVTLHLQPERWHRKAKTEQLKQTRKRKGTFWWRDNLERETENILWKRCSKQKEKEPREVVRARASERRRKKTHKRWLKDETGAQKKSRTLIDARRVMFEEDSRSPPTGLWCLRAPEIPSHVAENSVAASGERKINIHLSCDLTQCWI